MNYSQVCNTPFITKLALYVSFLYKYLDLYNLFTKTEFAATS